MAARRNVISIQASTATPDGSGGFTRAWATTHTARATKVTFGGSERFDAMRVTGAMLVDFAIRYQSGISLSHRVVEADGTVWAIKSISRPDNSNGKLVLLCALDKEGIGDA